MREIKFRAWDTEETQMVEWNDLRDTMLLEDGFDNKDCVLMQFIGLHDKNGKGIYEGDIIKDTLVGGNIFTLKWGSGMSPFGHYYSTPGEDWEVIGNVYENPELIK